MTGLGVPVFDAVATAGFWFEFHAQRIATPVRTAPSPFHHLQLLPAAAVFASVRAKNLFVKMLGEVRDRYGFALAGYVVMPNHIHLLIGEPAKGILPPSCRS